MKNPIWLMVEFVDDDGRTIAMPSLFPAGGRLYQRSERQVQWGSAQLKLNATFDLSSVISEYPQNNMA
jgi:hypothetical protein